MQAGVPGGATSTGAAISAGHQRASEVCMVRKISPRKDSSSIARRAEEVRRIAEAEVEAKEASAQVRQRGSHTCTSCMANVARVWGVWVYGRRCAVTESRAQVHAEGRWAPDFEH